jgi:phenylacetate-CoA ligase
MSTPSLTLDSREFEPPAERERGLMLRLPELIHRAQTAPGWARILQGVNAHGINTRAALARLPVTRKGDLKALQDASLAAGEGPFGGLNTTQVAQLGRLFMSPGPVYDPEGRGDDWWRVSRALRAAGARAGDVIHNCFSYHLTPGAWMIEGGARALGCPVIPAGSGQTEQQVQAIAALRPRIYTGTPSFLKLILDKAAETGTDVSSLQLALVGGEACPPSLEAWLREHGVRGVFQWYGTADIGMIGYQSGRPDDASRANPGLIIDEDLLVEIVRPGTGDVLADGEVGEVVVTSFNADYPLVRFGTGDMSAVLAERSPCGRTNLRIKGWMGRADQTTKVRGMFVHAGQVDQVVKRFAEIARARLMVEGELANDRMSLRCELRGDHATGGAPDGLAERIAEAIRDITKLRGDVSFVAAGSLPNDGKVIEDARKYE